MRGGMTMVGDMFDNALKARIDALCGESAQLLTTTTVFPAATPGSRSGGFTSANWWPTPPLPHPRRRYPTLHQAPPILSDEEFATKKAELLGKVAVVAVVGNEDGAHPHRRRGVPGAQRRRIHHPGPGLHILEWSGHGQDRLQRPRRSARIHCVGHRGSRLQRSSSGRRVEGLPVPALPFLTWEPGAHHRLTGCHLVSGWPTEVKRVRR
jgi:hypothetical protein